ncbi:MAG: EamA family transporter [Thermotogae bacterium]|nr:EamA family transporter [Thermotogota bacterium]
MSRLHPSLALLLASLLWGTSFPATEIALGSFSPGIIIFSRFLFSTLLLMAALRTIPVLTRDVIVAGLLNAVAFGLQFFGQPLTTASKVAIISNTFPIFTAMISPLILREYPTLRSLIAMAVGLAGVMLVGNLHDFHRLNLGDLMNLGASLSYALYVVFSRRAMRSISPTTFTVSTGAVSTLVSVAYIRPAFRFAPTPAGAVALIWLVLFPSTLGYLLYAYGISRRGAISSSVLILSTVLFGALASMLLLGERLAPPEWVGLLLIAVAILLA